MKYFYVIITFLLSANCFSQEQKQIPQFKKSSYPDSKFITKCDTFKLGLVNIIITMTQPKENSSEKFSCRSWLTIRKKNKIIHQEFYDIEPVGGCSGLYVPAIQPCSNYFIFSKFGDYNGQTLIIDSTGKLTTLTGGAFSISNNKNYLFATYDSDISGITVYDLKNKKTVLSQESKDERQFLNFYFQDNKYFVSIFNDKPTSTVPVGFIDIKNKKIVIIKKQKTFLKKSCKLNTYNAVQNLSKCNCGQ